MKPGMNVGPFRLMLGTLIWTSRERKKRTKATSAPVSRLRVGAVVCYLDEMGAQHTRLLLGAPGDLGGATTTSGAAAAAALAGHHGAGEGRVEQGRTGGGTLAARTTHGGRLLDDGGRGATARRSVRRGLFDNLLGSLFARLYVSNIWIYMEKHSNTHIKIKKEYKNITVRNK